jgi:hypothetical protein
MALSRDELLAELRKVVAANEGKVPGGRTFETATGIKDSAWKGRYWARFSDFVKDAGFDSNLLNQKISDADLLRQLADLTRRLGYVPVREEISMEARSRPGFPVWQTFTARFGGMPQTVAALLEFSRTAGDSALANLCEQRLERHASRTKPSSKGKHQTPHKVGFVYLKYSPSLRLYKIGKANDARKRGAGISLLLPEDLVPKHEIRTDCPFILEKYWANRFRDKRKQGEWYDLNSEDIKSFKQRREFLFSEFFP